MCALVYKLATTSYAPQVEAALTNDPSNEELLKLKTDLLVRPYALCECVVFRVQGHSFSLVFCHRRWFKWHRNCLSLLQRFAAGLLPGVFTVVFHTSCLCRIPHPCYSPCVCCLDTPAHGNSKTCVSVSLEVWWLLFSCVEWEWKVRCIFKFEFALTDCHWLPKVL